MLIIVAGATVMVLFYGESIWNKLSAGASEPPFFSWGENDDDVNATKEEFKSWRKKGNNGLSLTVINAMSPEWNEFFNQAISDWNAAPALNLKTEMASQPDPDCKHIPGKLKACNDFYGMSGWSGLNEAWLTDNYIITASTAKMNESYLKGKPFTEKQYVTCHELGHGFGLPHRDTNPNNIDLGTCLDYTTNYGKNMHPDEVDFENLAKLYGPSSRRLDEDDDDFEDLDPMAKPATMSRNRSYKDGRLLFKSDTKEIYEEILSDGGRIISTLLLAK